MALRYRDLLDILIGRAERLGLVDPDTNKADAAELELYLFQALLDIVEVHDLDTYMVNNLSLTLTVEGQPDYPMPDDYGRLIMPRSQQKRGIYLFNGVKNVDLDYVDPNSFARQTPSVPAIPTQFTVMRRTLWLYPSPDAAYGIRGLYIDRVGRPDLDDDVLLSYPTALINETLFLFASDMNRLTQSLAATRTEGLARLVGGNMGGANRIATQLVGAPGG